MVRHLLSVVREICSWIFFYLLDQSASFVKTDEILVHYLELFLPVLGHQLLESFFVIHSRFLILGMFRI